MTKAIEYVNNNINVIMDRSILSTLAVAYAFEKVGKFNAYTNAVEEYRKIETFFFLLL